MSAASTGDVLLVGSVPGHSVEHVFRLCARIVGERAFAFPDGELGPRQMWIGALGELVYSKHSDLEPLPDTHLPFGTYGVRAGVTEVSFDELYPYAACAIESYSTFTRLRDAGEIPAGARFQVSLPTPHAAVVSHFVDVERWPMLFDAWTRAMRRGYDAILEHIPVEDLVIQLDYCTEFADICGVWGSDADGRPQQERIRQHTDAGYIAPLSEGLPAGVALGYHVCLGAFPSWPTCPQEDLSLVVDVANRLIASTPRRVDFLHLPVMDDAQEAYFTPLRDLTRGPKVFLGLECRDGADALRRRSELASAHLSDFGVAHFCGYGREDADRVDDYLTDLAVGADALTTAGD
ncbi:hypothetical protein DSM104299_00437 [Baekduia alba]|uniref:hypothetical protein n=1 Tax=Baekduia alba TaxID=2997333 RepID=UPI002341AC58|nr:hypothetical protein [Baekduia alba]WCB91760.1 hypothetical protein DSM104299_00437 [Baekduia alba]